MRRVVIQAMLVVLAAVLLMAATVGLQIQPPIQEDPASHSSSQTAQSYLTTVLSSSEADDGSPKRETSPRGTTSLATSTTTDNRRGNTSSSIIVVDDGRCGGEYASSISGSGGLSEALYRKGAELYCPSSRTALSGTQHLLSTTGTWQIQPPTTDGEPIRHWLPTNFKESKWRRFSSQDARKCLNGARLVFVGNSNTRTLYTALEALLRDTPMMSRLGAKQLCDNRQSNHSCWARVEGGIRGSIGSSEEGGTTATSTTTTTTRLHYVSYVKDLYDRELEERVAIPFGFGKGASHHHDRHASEILFFNTGLNVIQGQHDTQWMPEHNKNAPKLEEFLGRFLRSVSAETPQRLPYFVWHPTTRLCPHQAHFKRYKYKPKVWRGRTLEQTNEAAAVSNSLIRPIIDRLSVSSTVGRGDGGQQSMYMSKKGRVQIVAGDEMLLAPEVLHVGPSIPAHRMNTNTTSRAIVGVVDPSSSTRYYPNHLCPLYDDPLHHRFYDREVIQVFLNQYCVEGS